ncbi:hypothetical protein M8C21_032198, partial [Ambrosia artemisiifolia]
MCVVDGGKRTVAGVMDELTSIDDNKFITTSYQNDERIKIITSFEVVDEIPHQENRHNKLSLNPQNNIESEFSDLDSDFSDEDTVESLEKDDQVVSLIDMGYSHDEASAAVKKCGKDAPLLELVDFISAAHLSKEADAEMDKLYFSSHLLDRFPIQPLSPRTIFQEVIPDLKDIKDSGMHF